MEMLVPFGSALKPIEWTFSVASVVLFVRPIVSSAEPSLTVTTKEPSAVRSVEPTIFDQKMSKSSAAARGYGYRCGSRAGRSNCQRGTDKDGEPKQSDHLMLTTQLRESGPVPAADEQHSGHLNSFEGGKRSCCCK